MNKVAKYILLTSVSFLAASQLMTGCSSESNQAVSPVDRDGLIVKSFSEVLTVKYFQSLHNNIDQLKLAADQLCTSENSQDFLPKAQDNWSKAMVDFHKLKVLLYAPASILEDSSPLRFIYSPFPSQKAEKFIQKQIGLAQEAQANYKMSRPLAHSTGLNALENLLFNIFDSSSVLTKDSGECVFLNYTVSELKERISETSEEWQEGELKYIQSPAGQADVRKTIAKITTHIVTYTDKRLKDLGLAAPLGLKPKQHPCEEATSCRDEYLEHPFYNERKIALVAPLEVLNDLFLGQPLVEKNATTPIFTFKDYINTSGPQVPLEKSNSGLSKALELTRKLPAGFKFSEAFSQESQNDLKATDILTNLKFFTDWLKVDFLAEMNTDIPKSVQGDND